MKRFSLIAVLALGGLVAASPVAFGQDKPAAAPGGGPSQEERTKAMIDKLGLSDEQRAKVETALRERFEKMSEIKDLPQDQRREKMQALMQDSNKKLKDILTPDQVEKWQKMQEEMRGKMQGKKGGGGAPEKPAETK